MSLDSTASIGGNEPLPRYGICAVCCQETDLRGYACIDCLYKSSDEKGKAQHDVLMFLDDEDSAIPGNYEEPSEITDGYRRIVRIDFSKSVKEVIRLCGDYKYKYLSRAKTVSLLNVREQWSRDRIKLLEAENEELRTRIAPPPEPDNTRKLDL